MTDQVALLDFVIKLAEIALDPPPQESVPSTTLRDIAEQVGAEGRKPCASADERVIGDEAVMLAQALLNRALHLEDGDTARAMRWEMIARCFMPFLRTDRMRFQAGIQILR